MTAYPTGCVRTSAKHDVEWKSCAHPLTHVHTTQAALDLAKQPEMKGKTICVIIPSFGER